MTPDVQTKMIRLADLVIDGQNVRKTAPMSIDELEDSIEKFGILNPLLVRPIENERYGVVCGTLRLKASQNIGLKEIPCIIRELNDIEAFSASATENIQRRTLDSKDEVDIARKAYEIAGTEKSAASLLQVSINWIHDRLAVSGYLKEKEEIIRESVERDKELEELEVPRDLGKIRKIRDASELLFPDDVKKRVEIVDILKDKPRPVTERVIQRLKVRSQTDSTEFHTKPLDETVREIMLIERLELVIEFNARVTKALHSAARDRGIAEEDIVEIAVEDWLGRNKYLE
ncbi:MAG: ParB/RepB/Spo0J family partition protein [Candidatus Thorarchaeota archaeon]